MKLLPQYFHVERSLQVAQVVTDHLLAESFACQQESCDGAGSIVDKLPRHQVLDARLRLPTSHTTHRHWCRQALL